MSENMKEKTFTPEFERGHAVNGIEVTMEIWYGRARHIRLDGTYPHDEYGWEGVAPITEEVAMVLLTGETFPSLHCNWFMNKGYVFYAEDYKWRYAIYNHDGYFSIIKREKRD